MAEPREVDLNSLLYSNTFIKHVGELSKTLKVLQREAREANKQVRKIPNLNLNSAPIEAIWDEIEKRRRKDRITIKKFNEGKSQLVLSKGSEELSNGQIKYNDRGIGKTEALIKSSIKRNIPILTGLRSSLSIIQLINESQIARGEVDSKCKAYSVSDIGRGHSVVVTGVLIDEPMSLAQLSYVVDELNIPIHGGFFSHRIFAV
ncbi:hypothetical protein [Bacillus sp. Marseille-P3800]|uniref:hypothetical protein n=1 Tax=Bacillus sp. Marseille-P3800 TaxID=2014782 RepID=UPI000C08320C|nr:hypothetical protein [Bacillus sp. Marseille-P3800]